MEFVLIICMIELGEKLPYPVLLAVIALLGSITYELYPWITAICLIYIIISVTGSSVIVVTCTRKGERKL